MTHKRRNSKANLFQTDGLLVKFAQKQNMLQKVQQFLNIDTLI